MRGRHPVIEDFPQVILNLAPNAGRHRAASDGPAVISVPVVEHMAQLRQQPRTDDGTGSAAIDEGREVAFEERRADMHHAMTVKADFEEATM